MIRKCVFFPIVTFSEFPIYGHSREWTIAALLGAAPGQCEGGLKIRKGPHGAEPPRRLLLLSEPHPR
jgi:hypothetical protein